MWKRIIVVDGDSIDTYKINGGVLYVVGADAGEYIKGIRFNEAEWASTRFDASLIRAKDGEEIESNPRRLFTMYIDNNGEIYTVMNEGLKLDEWTRANVVMELEALIDSIRNGG